VLIFACVNGPLCKVSVEIQTADPWNRWQACYKLSYIASVLQTVYEADKTSYTRNIQIFDSI
jgi:hypothetical protein